MADQLRLTFAREEEIAAALDVLAGHTDGFRSPQLVLIGGYALRAYVPLSRSTRDCDFAVRKGEGWLIDSIPAWLPGYQVTALDKPGDYGFLRCMKLVRPGGTPARVSLDFMEGMVVGREPDEVISLDAAFERDCERRTITVAGHPVEIMVPSYRDYFIMKVVSGRRSDVRDIAALVWKLGVPHLGRRVEQLLPRADVFPRKIERVIIPDLRDPRFLHSWRGTFVTREFSDEERLGVIGLLEGL